MVKVFKAKIDWNKPGLLIGIVSGFIAIISTIAYIIDSILKELISVSLLRITFIVLAIGLSVLFISPLSYHIRQRTKGKWVLIVFPVLIVISILGAIFVCPIVYQIYNLGEPSEDNIGIYEQLAERRHQKAEKEVSTFYIELSDELYDSYIFAGNEYERDFAVNKINELLNSSFFRRHYITHYNLLSTVIQKDFFMEADEEKYYENTVDAKLVQAELLFFINKDYENTLKAYQEIIESGEDNPIAYNNTGYLYALGLGTKQSDENALYFFEGARIRGSKVADGNIAMIANTDNLSANDILNSYIGAYKNSDYRMEIILRQIYDELAIEVTGADILDDFFSKDEEEQLDIIESAFEQIQIIGVTGSYRSLDRLEGNYKTSLMYGIIGEGSKVAIARDLIFTTLDSDAEEKQNSSNYSIAQAEEYIKSQKYLEASLVYSELESMGISSPIIYNNIGYMLSKGLGCSIDLESAKSYFDKAIQLNSKVAVGNLMAIYDGEISTVQEEILTIMKAYNSGDDRVNDYLKKSFKIKEIELKGNDYYTDFMSWEYDEQEELILACSKQQRRWTGTSLNHVDGTWIDTYALSEAPIREYALSLLELELLE